MHGILIVHFEELFNKINIYSLLDFSPVFYQFIINILIHNVQFQRLVRYCYVTNYRKCNVVIYCTVAVCLPTYYIATFMSPGTASLSNCCFDSVTHSLCTHLTSWG